MIRSSSAHFTEYFTDPAVDNLRINSIHPVMFPQLLVEEVPMSHKGRATVIEARRAMMNIIENGGAAGGGTSDDDDDRLLVVVGPCSIHDTRAAFEYAERLTELIELHKEDLLIVMRVYFEKPRTTVGWKGLINDPLLDDSCKINLGLKTAREVLTKINDIGCPCASELLDTLTPQYICDTLAWVAIGARTTESQIHRELASGLSMAVGFKNGTSGDVKVAVESCMAASQKHRFLSVTKHGMIAIVQTKGNKDCHVVLRGGSTGPNFEREHLLEAVKLANKMKVCSKILIDCSHANSSKDYKRQAIVCESICESLEDTETVVAATGLSLASSILGVMIESNINPGRQDHTPGVHNPADLKYGVSITDGCIGWEETVTCLDRLAAASRNRRTARKLNNKVLTAEKENV